MSTRKPSIHFLPFPGTRRGTKDSEMTRIWWTECSEPYRAAPRETHRVSSFSLPLLGQGTVGPERSLASAPGPPSPGAELRPFCFRRPPHPPVPRSSGSSAGREAGTLCQRVGLARARKGQETASVCSSSTRSLSYLRNGRPATSPRIVSSLSRCWWLCFSTQPAPEGSDTRHL